VEVEHLPDGIRSAAASLPHREPKPSAGMIRVPLGTPLEEVERLVIDETLRRTGGNRQRAAEMLGIAARTIYRKLAGDRDTAQ
jgi:two-component system response regulator HydG